MNRLLGLSGERPSEELACRFDGVGLIRGEYLCRQANSWITTIACRTLISNYLDEIALLFSGRPVWYRLIDMESSEVSTLTGCEKHIVEKTTMLGVRGVRRGLCLPVELDYELATVIEVAHRRSNVHLLLPFVSDASEVVEFAASARRFGFRNKLGVMAETPSAVLTLSDLIAAGAQEVVIGMNDLTSLTLGSARELYAHRKDHPAVLTLVREAVATANTLGTPLHAAGYLCREDLIRLENCGVKSFIAHYSHLPRLWPDEFRDLQGTVDLTAIKNVVRGKVHDPLIFE